LSCDDESDIVRTLTGGLTAVEVQIHQGIGRRTLDPRTILLTVNGAVDRRLALDLQRAIGQAVRCGRVRAIVELSDAGRIEPGVIAALLHARRRLLSIGGELTVVAPGAPFGIASPLPVAPTVEAALACPDFATTRRAVVEAVGPLRRALTRWTVDAGADQRTQEAVAIAGSEAITNAVVHAYMNDPEPGTVGVAGEVQDFERLHITVSDEGSGMQPRADSPGLGLGLPLIAQLAEAVDIDSRPGTGTRIAMDFAILSGR
jgi:anti-sigma regulatory factor (Ser/Thr protein kinase)/ABC-type transporter Mla MlaB component